MDLKEWTTHFVKNKDIFHKKIQEIKDHKSHIEVIQKDKKIYYYYLQEDLSLTELTSPLEESNKNENKHLTIVCLNKRSNLNILLQHWKKISEFQRCSIIFVNVDSLTERKWIIRPHIHAKIADPDCLKTGIEAMFNGVQEVL
jgi:hypothetical protein